ncbi:EAL domain-containing protein [Bradyrhizobium japonicum]|uniref:Cyclic-di-GMP phosphodiesterase TipF (Flagellum assembly factor) n=1 Tax=Bradyrhizobium japonicum TaxID=375 RepID=A0ABV2RMG5_BRAJP|nr:EAL domain-containing protein [Bradyrhizobium japonicum]MCP1762840.1 cyclic-di-GMP phosphodiesterase TipF (flagellum assembly factor) [Bradyrhizobium japonicum]MCP1784973.1 cyclic-di-GMP phosphodiesterase TipF (flagellum assembly factor) [Bradyrhizobium japonicum]MCP1806856.1 cyclic-di-GMP phosphodiesterase TipF (flagellum assembly factor) [Bradyrhizobium japonicum]MCP1815780.1 cyclic-di-GMP phosphodiesterase TipF (flagellum assembly factor) [Bradyrhizobium japonicum]MCP1872704.1 cyclic-di-
MIRISTIFIAICMVLVAASLGLVLYSVAGISGTESAIVALTALTFLILYNAVSMRLRDRSDVGGQIADLSRGTADLARQVAEFGRRLAAMEGRIASANSTNSDRIQSVVGEINELGGLVRQLATTVSAHEDLLAGAAPTPAPAPVARPEPEAPLDLIAAFEERPAAPPPLRAPPPRPTPAIQTQAAVPVQAANGRNQTQLLTTLRNAIDENRIDIFLQPMVTLPQRKVRFYEAVTRLRDERDQLIAAEEFISIAEASGLIGRIDNMVMLRCVQVLRRLMVRNKDVGVFCNVAASTLGNSTSFAQCLDFLEANRALAPSLVLEFKQSTFRNLGPAETENLAALAQRGFRFSIDHVTDLRIEPRELADRGVRFIKVPASLLLDPRQASTSDIHPSDLSDLLGRFGIDLIAERIEGERAVVDLLDFDVRFGQGFLFAPPRPLRPEGASATGGASPNPAQEIQGSNGSASPSQGATSGATSSAPPAPRITGNAALARRI